MTTRSLVLPLLAALGLACNQAGTPANDGATGSQKGAGGARPVAQAPLKQTLPVGTALPLVLETAVSSASNSVGDAVVATVLEDVKVGEKVVVPAGSEARGHVTAAVRSGKVKGLARLAFEFDSLVVKGKPLTIAATAVDITAENTKKKDAAIIGGATAGGAILGAIIDGKKGAAIGAGIGAAGGTGTVLATRGREVVLPAGQSLTVKLTSSVVI